MKLVKNEKELDSALSLAKQEAKKYFSNDEVYIEKYFEKPRHIEVQILSDKKTTIHMGERDCSVQRNHQKLIEESPSPILEEKTRQDLLNKTVKMVSKLDYEGAGTVEFIYDNGKFYFLEMNTLPGMPSTSLVPKSVDAVGMSFEELIKIIIELSL